MPKFQQNENVSFEKKAVENFRAGTDLLGGGRCNAAANRFYYCFVHLGLRNAVKTGAKEELYLKTTKGKNGTELRIDKSSICQNPIGLGIKQENAISFRKNMKLAENARIKADYTTTDVLPNEIQLIVDPLRNMIQEEGINIP